MVKSIAKVYQFRVCSFQMTQHGTGAAGVRPDDVVASSAHGNRLILKRNKKRQKF